MKSIEKLRKYVDKQRYEYNNHNVSFVWQLSTIADEIEAEIADNYMRLPMDADGVPIHVGDNLHSDETGRNFPCRGYNLTLQGSKKWWTVECCYDSYSGTSEYVSAKSCRHVKPRTLEDIVADAIQYGHNGITGDRIEGKVAEFCAEIRELLGGDAE